MAKPSRSSTQAKSKRRSAKVWHVYRFTERFELADDQRFCRKGPLIFSKDYVSPADDESVAYLRQVDALTRHRNGLELEGAWVRVRRAASARSRAFRGYLLTAEDRPMSDAEIGRTILFCEPRRASRLLKSLADVGLIEHVICPTFDLSLNEPLRRKPRKKAPSGPQKAKSQKKKSGRRDSVSRENSENLERARDPLRAKMKNEMASGREENANKPDTENTSVPGKPPRNTPERSVSPTASGPRRDSRGPDIVRLGMALPRALDSVTHAYALHADDFAAEVFALLRCPFDRDSAMGRREIGNFRAALLEAIDGGLSPEQIEEVIGKSKVDAGRIGKARRRYYANNGNPEQYWRFLFGKHLDARRGRQAMEGA